MRKDFIMALAVLSLGACVEDTYDLDKDLDTSVTIGGGELTTPPIEVEPITLDNILDLDDDSNVKALQAAEATKYGLADGDYVFTPNKAEGSSSNVDVQAVKFRTNSDKWAGKYDLPEITIRESDLQFIELLKPMLTGIEVPATKFAIDFGTNDIPGEVRALNAVDIKPTGIRLHFGLENASGCSLTYEEGFTISLPETFVPDIEKSKKLGGFTDYSYADHKIRFNKPYEVSHEGDILLELAALDMTTFTFTPGKGQHGSYADNGSLEGDLAFSVEGKVSIDCGQAGTISPRLTFKASAGDEIELTAITGIVDPNVDIHVNPITVSGIPSCLTDDQTDLAIANPMIFLTVNNPTGMAVDLGEIYFSSQKGGRPSGAAQTAAITLSPGLNKLVVCPKSFGNDEWKHVACANLPDIIRSIPDNVYVEIPNAKVAQEVQVVQLDKHYTVTTEYDVVAPLAMKAGSQIRYEKTLDGLADDLDDIDEISKASISLDYTNTIPMAMELPNEEIVVLNAAGNAVNDVSVHVEGSVKSGTPANPASGSLKLEIRLNDGGKLSNFDGLRLVFKAMTDDNASGVTLNQSQTLTITRAQLTISGGVTMEL